MSGKKLDYKTIIEHWIRNPDIGTLTVNEKGRHYYRVEVTSYIEAFSSLLNTIREQGHSLEQIQSDTGAIVGALKNSLTPPKWEKNKEWHESIRNTWMFILNDAMVRENPISISKPDSGVMERYKESRKQERAEKKEKNPAPKNVAKKRQVIDNKSDEDSATKMTKYPPFDYSNATGPLPVSVMEDGLLARLLDEAEAKK